MNDRLKKLALIAEQLASKIPDGYKSKENIVSWLKVSPYSPYVTLYGGENSLQYDEDSSFVSLLDNKRRYTLKDNISFKFENFVNYDNKIYSANTRLYNVIDSTNLFKAYPEFKDIEVSINITDSHNGNYSGTTYHRNGKAERIEVFADNNENAMRVLLHEMQHCIQLKEGFELGASYYNEHGVMDLFVGVNANKEGVYQEESFSDVATQKTMQEINDSQVALKEYPYSLSEAVADYRTKAFINKGEPLTEEIWNKIKHFENYSEEQFFRESDEIQEQIRELLKDDENFKNVIDEVKALSDKKEPYDTMKTLMRMRKYGKLSDYIEHPKLFEKYPEFKDLHVRYGEIGHAKGKYQRKTEWNGEQIVLSEDYFGVPHLEEDLLSTLLHETQHAIQDLEGWAKGGNMNQFKDEYSYSTLKQDLAKEKREILEVNIELKNLLRQYSQGSLNEDEVEYLERLKELSGYKKIQDELIKLDSVGELPNDKAFEMYRSLWGEQQARAVQYRINMSDKERQKESWTETLARVEGKYSEPIIKFNTSEADSVILEEAFLKDDGKVKQSSLFKLASSFKSPINSYSKFKKSFGLEKEDSNIIDIETPIGSVEIGLKSQYYKLKTWKENRVRLSGIIKDTLENPLFIVDSNEGKKYYAPYKGKNGLEHIFSITEDKDGIDILKTNYKPFNMARLKQLIKLDDNKLLYARSDIHSLLKSEATQALLKDKSGVSYATNESISDNDSNVKQNIKSDIISKELRDKNFKEWFGDSKVVDKNGEPLVVFHGTNADFSEFDKAKVGQSTDSGMYGDGFYFTNDSEYANHYAKNGSVMPVCLKFRNPLIINEKNQIPQIDLKLETIEDMMNSDKKYSQAFRKKVISMGYDGVIDNISGNGRQYVAFEPTQIKSIHNKGTFNPDNPNILEKNDYGLRHIEKVLSILPDDIKTSTVKDYLSFNGISHEQLRGSVYQDCLNNETFTNPVKINKDIDTNSSYYQSKGEIESRDIEDIYINQSFDDFVINRHLQEIEAQKNIRNETALSVS